MLLIGSLSHSHRFLHVTPRKVGRLPRLKGVASPRKKDREKEPWSAQAHAKELRPRSTRRAGMSNIVSDRKGFRVRFPRRRAVA